jgi:hypothetical protein
MPTHPHERSRFSRWLLLASGACACVGTPTPEPPDYTPDLLPTPDGGRIFGTPEVVTLGQPADAPVRGPAGSVTPNSQVWIINLDDPTVLPSEVTASATGSFAATVRGSEGDRVRIVSRTQEQHSLPLDAQLVRSGVGVVQLASLPQQQLDCLQVTPAVERSERVELGRGVVRGFSLTNRCSDVVDIEQVQLRLGAQGFVLGTPPGSVPIDGTATLELTFEGHAEPRERADILLLDVQSGGTRGRYALGLWSVSSAGTGND